MTDKEFVLTTMREYGLRRAQDLQETSEGMTGTELYEKEDYIPDFSAAVAKKNMLERKAGMTDGFLCRSSAELRQRHLSAGAGRTSCSVGVLLVQ